MHDRQSLTPEHDQHDRVLIARFAAGDAYPTERDQAQQLIEGCSECSALASDIRLISSRTRDLSAVSRPRDFRLTPEQADRLRGSWFDRLMRGLASPGWTAVRPLAGAAAAIGLALIVVGALPLSSLSGGVAFDAPAVTSQSGGLPSTPRDLITAPQAPATSEHQQDASSASIVPAATTDASKAGAEQSSLPGTTVDYGGSPPANSATTPEAALATSPEPGPEVSASRAPALVSVAPTAGQAFAAPTTPPPPPQGDAPVAGQSVNPSTVAAQSVDKPALVVLGMVLALVSLLVLGLAIVARRRYSDPLAR